MKINESAENYLETILILSQRLPVVRSIDVAVEMGFKKSSVSVAMKNLREKGHIVVSEAGYITLTESGKEIADMIYERHNFLSSWLIELGVDENIATADACRIEHVISPESFAAIKKICAELIFVTVMHFYLKNCNNSEFPCHRMPAKLSYNSKKVFICAFGDYHLNKNGKSGILKKLENPDFPFL